MSNWPSLIPCLVTMPVYKQRALSTWVGGKQQDDAEEQEVGHRGWTIRCCRHPPLGCSQVHQGLSAHFSPEHSHRQLSFADAARLTSAASSPSPHSTQPTHARNPQYVDQQGGLYRGYCTQGCIFRLTCSYPELTEDHVLTNAYVKICRTVTRNAVNKSV